MNKYEIKKWFWNEIRLLFAQGLQFERFESVNREPGKNILEILTLILIKI